jgi:hypothetical protein
VRAWIGGWWFFGFVSCKDPSLTSCGNVQTATGLLTSGTSRGVVHVTFSLNMELRYSFEQGPAHMVMLCSYADFSVGSAQYQWLQEDLAKIDRTKTPWVIGVWHTPWCVHLRSRPNHGLARVWVCLFLRGTSCLDNPVFVWHTVLRIQTHQIVQNFPCFLLQPFERIYPTMFETKPFRQYASPCKSNTIGIHCSRTVTSTLPTHTCGQPSGTLQTRTTQ